MDSTVSQLPEFAKAIKRGDTVVPFTLLRNKNLRGAEKFVASQVFTLSWARGFWHGTKREIAKSLGLSAVTVSRCLKKLESKGIIESGDFGYRMKETIKLI